MARTKRRQPYNPALAEYQRQQEASESAAKRSRIATDFNRGIAKHITALEIVDPNDLDGGVITVARQTRNDPLGGLHARKSIDEAQYQAGRAFQSDFETIQSRPQAVDFSQPYVDRSFKHRGISDAYSKALDRLNAAHKDLGIIGSPLTHDVLIRGQSMSDLAKARGLRGERWEKYLGMRFRECLDTLAVVYDLAMEKR